MKFMIKVLVQIPDGTVALCPIVGHSDTGTFIKTFDSRKHAIDFAEFILPERLFYDSVLPSYDIKVTKSRATCAMGPGADPMHNRATGSCQIGIKKMKM